MRSTPRPSRSRIATHVGALLLCALWPSAVGAAGAEAATESEALPPPVQGQVLLQRETLTLATAGMHWQAEGSGMGTPVLTDTGHAEEAAAGGEGISGSFPDNTYGLGGFVSPSSANLSLEGRVSRIEGYLPHLATKADVQDLRADLRATEGLLRAELQEGLRTQLLHFLWIMGGMLTVLGGILVLVMRFVLLPVGVEIVVGAVVRRLKEQGGTAPPG